MKLFPFLLAAGITATAQEASQPPASFPAVTVRRQPPPGTPDPQQYPFSQILNKLQEDAPVQNAPPPAQSSAKVETIPAAELPKAIPISQSAEGALALGKNWMSEKHEPAPGKDGRVLYTFGVGLPTIVCAPLRVCVLELEPGEKIVGEPHIGDSVRWTISPAAAGKPEAQMIVIKPKQAGLDTNLLVPTDRRAYYVRLVSKPEDYLARVAFAYPDDEAARWQQHFREEEAKQRKQQAEASAVAPVEALENLYFDYRISGGDEFLRPVRVVDDGRKTFVQMPAGATVREAPVLGVVGANGPEMVNYRVKGDVYIVDRLFERGALILGVGKKQRRADIVRGTYRGKDAGKLLDKAVTEQAAATAVPEQK
jgi:type IV secretion system protein TrbG